MPAAMAVKFEAAIANSADSSAAGQRCFTLMPNSGPCVPVCLRADLYTANGCDDRQFSLVARIGGAPADSARLRAVSASPLTARKSSSSDRPGMLAYSSTRLQSGSPSRATNALPRSLRCWAPVLPVPSPSTRVDHHTNDSAMTLSLTEAFPPNMHGITRERLMPPPLFTNFDDHCGYLRAINCTMVTFILVLATRIRTLVGHGRRLPSDH